MAGAGKFYNFHGCFRSKESALKKEMARAGVGAFVKRVFAGGRRCFLVLSPRR